MPNELHLHINGQPRVLALPSPATLDTVVRQLELRADRIAVERNGDIVPRGVWPTTTVESGDRLEIVHFVGGGF